jgi:asparagine synthase (glutamine-hydrolysing)
MDDLDTTLPLVPSIFSVKSRKMLIQGMSSHFGNAKKLWNDRIPFEVDLIQRATKMDFLNYLPGDILTKVDRASMLNSIEMRSPFLDYRIIEFGFSKIPSSMKVTDSDKKIILKKIGKKILPNNFDYQRKQGFSIPLGKWLQKGNIRDMMMGELLGSDCIFDKRMINQLFIDQKYGYSNSERIFTLFQFEVWRKKNLLSV